MIEEKRTKDRIAISDSISNLHLCLQRDRQFNQIIQVGTGDLRQADRQRVCCARTMFLF
jgi:hypothetical protein